MGHLQDLQEAAGPQEGLTMAEKAERKRAKKARQRAAQSAAQTAKVRRRNIFAFLLLKSLMACEAYQALCTEGVRAAPVI